ncbi:MAG: M3 family oligoendopeptidase [Chloroflexota bacterium]
MTTYTQSRWSLDDLFPALNGPEVKDALAELDRCTAAFEAHRAALAADMPADAFLAVVRDLEALNHQGYRVYGFASLSFAADTQDQLAQSFMGQVMQKLAEMENRTLFFSLWWKDLDEAAAARLLDAAGDYRYWLEQMRLFKPHTLSEAEEKIINIKNTTGFSALTNLYDSITNRYTFKITVDGEPRELTRGELMVYARHADPELRRAAYQELYRVYGEEAPVLGQIYQYVVQDWRNEQVSLRHFPAPISARNLINDIPDAVVDTLVEVSRQNAPVFQRYFRLKARKLGMQRLRRYDVYAPISASDKRYDFNQAAGMVLDSFAEFNPGMARLAQRVFDQGHLDSEVRKGKRSGAFCATVTPDLAPWVLVNYQGRADDVATLAHEMGHAVHSLLADQHSLFTQHACLPLAETASTFGEMMLIDRLLANESDPGVRRDMLFRQVDDAYATIQRQIYFAMFERTAHEMIQQGASVDEVSKAYMENLAGQFGDAVDVAEEFRYEWVSIPHFFHTPFYVYAYSFGQLLVLSLYQQFKAEGASFKPRYLQLLSAGGSLPPMTVLDQAGVDVRQAAFWQGGYDVVARAIEQLEQLPD